MGLRWLAPVSKILVLPNIIYTSSIDSYFLCWILRNPVAFYLEQFLFSLASFLYHLTTRPIEDPTEAPTTYVTNLTFKTLRLMLQ